MDPGLTPVPLSEAHDEAVFGGKAVSLGRALRSGLPVPPGAAVPVTLVDRIAGGDVGALASVLGSPHLPGGALAVRSSAVGEDSGAASFAGQHATCLNVRRDGIGGAIRVVWESARSEAALGYRARRGLEATPRIAVVVQRLLEPLAAGVLFTRDPVSGADERVVEATWGLGEAVVSGRIVPDRYRFDRSGRLVERTPGYKDISVRSLAEEGVCEQPVPEELRAAPCLTSAQIDQLHLLVERCAAVWGPDLDLEWALGHDGKMYLLQCRPISTTPGGGM